METYIDFVKIEPCENNGGISSHIGTTAEGAEYLLPDDLYQTRIRNLWTDPARQQKMLRNWDAESVIENV
jgi:hypothetical protein